MSEGQGYSLAASSERTLCATVTCLGQPSPPNRRWRADKDFVGCTPLHDPEDADVDIVAITGLARATAHVSGCETSARETHREHDGSRTGTTARWPRATKVKAFASLPTPSWTVSRHFDATHRRSGGRYASCVTVLAASC